MNTRFLDGPLAAVGYRRIKQGVYAFDASSSDCTHLLDVQLHGKSDRSLTADFCMLNGDAEKFALDALRKFGDPAFKNWNNDTSQSVLRFSVGEVADWKPGDALWQRQASEDEFAKLFAEVLKERIVPIAKRVASAEELLRTLLSNDPPYKWIKSNGAIRAAEIVFLACRQGIDGSAIRSQLQPYLKEVEIGLGSRHVLDAASFVDAVVASALPAALH